MKDPDVQLLLHSPTETPDMYVDVVKELKERFNKTREIHHHLTKALIQLPSPKQTRVDLRRIVDSVKRTMDSIKATKYYDLDSFLSSLVYLTLPPKLQTLWDQHSKKEKGVPPVTQLLAFIREHAETLPSTATSTQPSSEKPGENSAKKTPRKSDRNQDYQSSKPRSNVYTVSPAPSYKWECALCRPEKHPLHSCPKWAAYDVTQRLGHIQAKSLCSNCLAGGHATSACKSTYRCRECGQAHHTTIHQQPAAVITSINSSTVQSHQVPDALMTTAQVILIGPKGQELKARALIDSGAGLSLVSKWVTQLLDLPLEPSNLQFSAVQGAPCKPSNYLTSLLTSPLQNKEKQILCKPAVVQMVTCDLPPEPIQPVTDLPHIMGLELADVTYHIPGRIDILLGADLVPQIMVKRLLRSGADSEPIAQATQFGWAISGPIRRKNSSTPPIPTHHHLVQPSDPRLDHLCLLSQLWKTEQPEEEASPSLVQEQVQQHHSVNVTCSPSECRSPVTLPRSLKWRQQNPS